MVYFFAFMFFVSCLATREKQRKCPIQPYEFSQETMEFCQAVINEADGIRFVSHERDDPVVWNLPLESFSSLQRDCENILYLS